ncbi:hypothetical protein B0H17DRAFT_1147034 [Mycena rosella]|uniref:Uncharacterized protein n=1 Tax=Mycena rosella TaxID=1033263 RepID=A0AAD7G081_MYCRO|nr:hypothetical protein B0H17DRAFT_1147034 [Mycena rosella]
MADCLKHAFQFALPRGGAEAIIEYENYSALMPGGVFLPAVNDYVFVRNTSGSGLQIHDILAMTGLSMDELRPEVVKQAQVLRERIIGPAEECGPHKPQPVKVDGGTKLAGGFAFEREWRSESLEGAPRAYPISTTIQTPRGALHAPAAGNKSYALERYDAGKCSYWCSMQAETMNVPRVGCSVNKCFSALQMNLTYSEGLSRWLDPDLIQAIEELGIFGFPHIGKGDAPAGVTAVSIFSNLEPEIDPGVIVALELGIGRVLTPLTISFFCGLRVHAGTSPTFNDLHFEPLKENNGRCLVVDYMTTAMLDGQGISALGALPGNKLLTVGPELAHKPQNIPFTDQANYIADGGSIMEPADHVEFVARELLVLVNAMVHQFSSKLKSRLDRKQFLSSITWEDENGTRHRVGDWDNGPGYGPGGESFDEEAEEEGVPYGNRPRWDDSQEYLEYADRVGSSMPVFNLLRQVDDTTALSNAAAKGQNVLVACDVLLGKQAKKEPAGPAGGCGCGHGRGGGNSNKPKASGTRKQKGLLCSFSDAYLHIGGRKLALEDLDEDSDMERDYDARSDDDMEQDGEMNLISPEDAAKLLSRASAGITGFPQDSEMTDVTNTSGTMDTAPPLVPPEAELNSSLHADMTLSADHPVSDTAASTNPENPAEEECKVDDGETEVDAEERRTARRNIRFFDELTEQHLQSAAEDARHALVQCNKQKQLEADARVLHLEAALNTMVHDPLNVSAPVAAHSATRLVASLEEQAHLQDLARPIFRQRIMLSSCLVNQWLNMSNYIPALKGTRYCYCSPGHASKGSGIMTEPERAEHVRDETIACISAWLGYRFQSVAARIVGDRRLVTITQKDFEPFLLRLQQHDISHAKSKSRWWLKELGDVFTEVRKRMASSSSIPRMPPSESDTTTGPQPRKFLHFLRIALKAIRAGSGGSNTELESNKRAAEATLLRTLLERSDHMMPIREHGQSYKAIHAEDGPFSPDWLETRSGFFSALLWRGVTYHTDIVKDHARFDSLANWQATTEHRDLEYYSDGAAYGGFPNQKRAKDVQKNASIYLEETGKAENLKWLTADEPPTYMEMSEWLNSDCRQNEEGKKVRAFPQIGGLAAHLLISDYVAHGKVQTPEPRQMGHIIFKINAGGAKGLVRLGYIVDNSEQCEDTFEELYNRFQANPGGEGLVAFWSYHD